MNEPMQGQKTTVVAAVFTIMQALVMSGVLPAEVADTGSQAAAGLFGLTLALKGLRAAKRA